MNTRLTSLNKTIVNVVDKPCYDYLSKFDIKIINKNGEKVTANEELQIEKKISLKKQKR